MYKLFNQSETQEEEKPKALDSLLIKLIDFQALSRFPFLLFLLVTLLSPKDQPPNESKASSSFFIPTSRPPLLEKKKQYTPLPYIN